VLGSEQFVCIFMGVGLIFSVIVQVDIGYLCRTKRETFQWVCRILFLMISPQTGQSPSGSGAAAVTRPL
jgi:hypothetical protein